MKVCDMSVRSIWMTYYLWLLSRIGGNIFLHVILSFWLAVLRKKLWVIFLWNCCIMYCCRGVGLGLGNNFEIDANPRISSRTPSITSILPRSFIDIRWLSSPSFAVLQMYIRSLWVSSCWFWHDISLMTLPRIVEQRPQNNVVESEFLWKFHLS